LYTYGADKTVIDARNNQYRPLNAKYLDYAVNKALSDCKDSTLWTDDAKAKACATLGAYRKPTDGWVLKGTITSDNMTTGVTVDMSGCAEMIIVGWTIGSGNSTLTTNITSLMYQNAINGTRYSMLYFSDTLTGIHPYISKYNDGTTEYTSPLASNALVYTWIDGHHIRDITSIRFSNSNVTSCDIKIYAR